MTCDRCPEPATWHPDETACNTAHCDEHLALCRYCTEEMAGEVA